MIQSRGLCLQAAVVLPAVTLGGNLAGIVSLLAVPAALLIAVVWNHVREEFSEPLRDPEDIPGPGHGTDPEPAAAPLAT